MDCKLDEGKAMNFAKKFKKGSFVGKFVLKSTECMLPFLFLFSAVITFIGAIYIAITLMVNGAVLLGIFALIFLPIIGVALVILSYYFIFVIKDIREKLRIIADLPEDSCCCKDSCETPEKASKTSEKKVDDVKVEKVIKAPVKKPVAPKSN